MPDGVVMKEEEVPAMPDGVVMKEEEVPAMPADAVEAEEPAPANDVDPTRCRDCVGPSLRYIFGELIASNRKYDQWLQYFESNCQSYGWDTCCASCEYSENYGCGFCDRLGAETLASNIRHFLGYYVPKNMGTPSPSAMKQAAATLRALVNHCVVKGYVVKDPELLKQI